MRIFIYDENEKYFDQLCKEYNLTPTKLVNLFIEEKVKESILQKSHIRTKEDNEKIDRSIGRCERCN